MDTHSLQVDDVRAAWYWVRGLGGGRDSKLLNLLVLKEAGLEVVEGFTEGLRREETKSFTRERAVNGTGEEG